MKATKRQISDCKIRGFKQLSTNNICKLLLYIMSIYLFIYLMRSNYYSFNDLF